MTSMVSHVLYGKNKKPKPAQLADIDLVIFDIQDVGARFYTYISTMQNQYLLRLPIQQTAIQHKPNVHQ